METLIYILKANLYCTLFYVCYWVLLRRHTFFRLNRLYLVGTLFLSLVLPFVEFTEIVKIIPVAIKTLPEPSVHLAETSSGLQIVWLQLTLILYGLSVVFMLTNLLRGFYKLYLLLKQGEWIEMESYTLILLPETAAKGRKLGSFSFLNFLVVSNHDYEHCFDTILRHEHVHIMQKHSYDILLVEVLKAACWFNPALWLYKYSIREVHEFLADQQAENKEVYASFLVSYAQEAAYENITSNFFNSILLKDRITMIYRNTTSNWSLSKYLLIILIMAFAVMKTAARNQVFIEARRTQGVNLSHKVEKSYKGRVQDSTAVIKKKGKVKKITYNHKSSSRNADTIIDKPDRTKLEYVSRVSKHQDSLWEAYDPKAGQINYYNKAKIKRIKPFYPALVKYGKEFGKSLDLSAKDAPETRLQHYSLGLKSPYESYPSLNIKKVIR